ncbi:cystathionine beta-lyase [Marasmius tenuissimus]|uniref:Cysteine-S-conjugate beta-lyase n=1 Tax=Marasmius tenuissimus TaxID=585030 RepID=A0ABR2ZWU6_9AGAR|nr:cystathionine beta-lyase [Marasmius tenuissimus]
MGPSVDTKHPRLHDLPTPEPESPLRSRKPYKFSTLCATVENPDQKDQYGSSSVPIYQTATFKGVAGEYDYSRSGNPTRSHLEHHIAKISSANHAFAVSSGMAALDVILRILKPGDEVIAGDDLYGGTNRLLAYLRNNGGVTVHHVDTTDPSSIIPYINPTKTAMVLLESPTNPLLKIADIALISKEVKERAPDAIVVVDNTMMSPYLQRPLEHGADVVYDSATKYLSGHHDLMAGVVTCNRDDIAKKIGFTINAVGNALTPFDCFLLLRGVKTLAVRLDRQQATASLVATYLHSLGFKVHYPGLPSHPRREVHQRIADGNGAVLSFETGNKEVSEKIVGGTRLWGISVSFGCVNSLISMPCVMSHASIDPATRAARGLPEDLIRLCVGIEDSADLLDDLEQALVDAGAIAYSSQFNRYVRVETKELPLEKAVEKLAIGSSNSQQEWFVSAPGKVILFGEHAVVHGVTAIAASVDLRCYGLLTPRDDGKVSVFFNDISDFYQEWDIKSLPWGKVLSLPMDQDHPEDLDQALIDGLHEGPLKGLEYGRESVSSLVLLYLYMKLSRPGIRPGFNFTARSTLPVGAGLGSSASFSSCAATALLLVTGRIRVPELPPRSSDGHIHVSHEGRRAIPPNMAERINKWAYTAEKILHGNPSGVDNSVSVYGGALGYVKEGFGKKSGMEPITGFKSLRFLLTNTKVSRDTKKLVAGVGQKKLEEPDLVDSILKAVQHISEEAWRALADPELSRKDLISGLAALITENHNHLVTLGVSHPSLEAIREKTAGLPYGLSTKLTGAGGGGCAVTLIPDDFKAEALKDLIAELSAADYDPYMTSVGGSGLGILSPYEEHRNKQAVVDGLDDTIQGAFKVRKTTELTPWANDLGRWLYV